MSTISPWMSVVFDVLSDMASRFPQVEPEELPKKVDAAFWEVATRLEFKYRDQLSEKIRLALTGNMQSVGEWSPILCWLCSKRIDWTTQLLLESSLRGVNSYDESPLQFLLTTMVDKWPTEGAVAFWDHAMEREGHPPDDFVS